MNPVVQALSAAKRGRGGVDWNQKQFIVGDFNIIGVLDHVRDYIVLALRRSQIRLGMPGTTLQQEQEQE